MGISSQTQRLTSHVVFATYISFRITSVSVSSFHHLKWHRTAKDCYCPRIWEMKFMKRTKEKKNWKMKRDKQLLPTKSHLRCCLTGVSSSWRTVMLCVKIFRLDA